MTELAPHRGPSRWLALAAVVGGVVLNWLGIGAVASSLFGGGYSACGHVVRAVGNLPLVLGLLWLVLRWQQVPAARYGLAPDGRTPRDAALGALAYLVPFTAAAVVIVGLASLSVAGSWTDMIHERLIVLVLVLLYEAIPEELVFRGYLFASLAERWPPWAAVVGQAVLFCLFGAAVGAARSGDRQLLFLLFSLSVGATRQVTGSVFAPSGSTRCSSWPPSPFWGTSGRPRA